MAPKARRPVRGARPGGGGADDIVLEARERPGGRVEQELLPNGRPVQYGGEVVADWMGERLWGIDPFSRAT
jgi:monoamine oxidase